VKLLKIQLLILDLRQSFIAIPAKHLQIDPCIVWMGRGNEMTKFLFILVLILFGFIGSH